MSHLIYILEKILKLDTWKSEIYVDIENLQDLNPKIKLLSIKKYLRNAGFLKSKKYSRRNIYYYRWININTGIPLFHKNMNESMLPLFRSGSVVRDSEPFTDDEIFDAIEYNYEIYGIQLYENMKYNLDNGTEYNLNTEYNINIEYNINTEYIQTNTNYNLNYLNIPQLNSHYPSFYLPKFKDLIYQI